MSPTDTAFRTKGKVVFLRYSRLARIPTAVSSSEILAEAGIAVLAYEFGNPREAKSRIEGLVPRRRLSCLPLAFLPRFLRSGFLLFWTFGQLLWDFVALGKPRLLVAHGIMEQALAWALSRCIGTPYVVHVHEVYEPKDRRGMLRWLIDLEPRALRGAVFTIFSESHRQKTYRAQYQLKQPSYLAFNCPRLRKKGVGKDLRKSLGLPAESKILLYIGGLEDKNGLSEAVEALKLLPNVVLCLVGWATPHYWERLQKTATECGVRDRVKYIGPVEDRWEYLDAADLTLCLYHRDEFRTQHLATASNKLMESIASLVPVLVSEGSDFQAFLKQYPVGRSVQMTPEGIAVGVAALLEPTAWKNASACAERAHQSQLNYEFQYRPILEALKSHLS